MRIINIILFLIITPLVFTQNDFQKMKNIPIEFVHIRHSTSIIKIGDKKILVDPMLSAKESLPSVKTINNELKNPRTELPFNRDSIALNVDYLLLTHLHFDHFDKEAIATLSKKIPVLCSKTDVKAVEKAGFLMIHPIANEYEIDGIKIIQYPAIHGIGVLKYMMGKGSSYLIEYKGFKIFLTGDCLLTGTLKNNLIQTKPDIVIANAGAAKLKFGKPITMSIRDIQEISSILPESKILVVHLDAVNHCTETRAYCKELIRDYPNIYIPNDGEKVEKW